MGYKTKSLTWLERPGEAWTQKNGLRLVYTACARQNQIVEKKQKRQNPALTVANAIAS